MMTIAIDPGAHTGWAIFDAGLYLADSGTSAPADVPKPWGEYRVVIEWPIARSWGRRAGGASLVQLAAHAGEALGVLRAHHVARVLPSEWKGSTPKPPRLGMPYIIASRVLRILTPLDIGAPLDTGREWDRWDAIGLGLVHLGRAGRGVCMTH